MNVCRTVPGTDKYLGQVKTALCSYLSHMLDITLDADGKLQRLLGHKVKQNGMGIQNPTALGEGWLKTSLKVSKVLISKLKSKFDMNEEKHKTIMRATRYRAVKVKLNCDKLYNLEGGWRRTKCFHQRERGRGSLPTQANMVCF